LVRQVDIDERTRLFLQLAMHVFSSPLQRIGAETAGAAESTANAVKIASTTAALRKGRVSSESIICVMSMS